LKLEESIYCFIVKNVIIRTRGKSVKMVEKRVRPIEKVEREGTGYADLEKYEISEDEMLGQFEFQHAKYSKIVEEVCDGWSKAKNSDWFLYIEVLRCLGLCEVTSGSENFTFKIPREKLKFIPSFETISRVRRSLNSKGLCLPDNPQVIEKRMLREKAIRKFFQKEKSL
jgi:hypothetical protein